jgi:mono/diheme cytochrome c family protein
MPFAPNAAQRCRLKPHIDRGQVTGRRFTLRIAVRFVSVSLLSLMILALAGCSLAAPAPVGTSRPAEQPPAAAQQQPAQAFQLPTRHPSAANGAVIYQQKCVDCHGAQGRGDGQFAAQLAQTGFQVADLTADTIARAQTPEQWYGVVSNGRLEKRMPGFAGSLDVDQRWDVIAYAWSLTATPQQIANGKQVYAEQCAHCHGESGKGDGKDAQGQLSDLGDFATLAQVAPGIWDQAMVSGHVPSFAGTLSEADRRAAIDYVRTFAYDYPAGTPSAASSSATPAAPGTSPATTSEPAEPIKIEGSIINGTAGQQVPDNLPLTLYIVPHQGSQQDMITRTYQSGVNGHFVITDAQITSSNLVAVGVDYKDLTFFSGVAPAQPQMTLPITIYESTSDAAQIAIETLHILVEPGTDGLNVSEIYVLSNNGDRFVAGFGRPVLHVGLPADATDIRLDPSLQRVMDQSGDGLDYYAAIPVGQQVESIVYQYTLPVTATSLSRTIYQPIAVTNLLLGGQAGSLAVTSDRLKPAGTQTIPASPDTGQTTAQTFQQYTAEDLQPGQPLSLTINAPSQPIDWRILLGIGLIVVGGVGLVLWQRSQKKQPAAERNVAIQKEALIDQIAALDDEFAEGRIDEVNYKAKRAKLKDKLVKLMEAV